jgi:probable F420-dependent oxidoreductase
LVEAARAAEAHGFDAAWVTDHPFPVTESKDGHQAHDPFVALAYIAAATSRIGLHISLVVLPYRNPFLVARSVATLDHLSAGRTIVAIGSGYAKPEFAALGTDFATREQQMQEGIAAMRAAWTGESVELESPRWSAQGNTMLPRPTQLPHPPLWRAGNSRRAIASAARDFDGWTPFEFAAARAASRSTVALESVSELRDRIGRLRQLEGEAERSQPIDVCLVRPRTTWYNRPDDEVREELAELEDMGVTWIAPQLEDARTLPEYLEHLERVAALAGLQGT